MALRSIDNALPITPERVKKQAKLDIKPPVNGVNDENRAPLPVSAEITIDYTPTEYLEAITDPECKIQGLTEELDSKDWIKVCESLNTARRIAIFHSCMLHPVLDKVMVVLVKSIKNPRSALCKTSIMASSDMFTAFGDKLLESKADSFDSLLLQLLLKASQDKRFVCEEAERALSLMVKSMTSLPLLLKLKGFVSHRNLRVRAKAAISICNCVSKMGIEDMKEFGIVSLLKMVVDVLNDKLPEAREAARKIGVSVYEALTKNEEEKFELWQSLCLSNLTPIHALSMIKLIPSSQ